MVKDLGNGDTIKIKNTMKELQKAIDKVNETFRNNRCSFRAEYILDVKGASIEIDGDWKHDHAYADYIMEQNGFKKISENVIEDTECDWYNSIHYYIFTK